MAAIRTVFNDYKIFVLNEYREKKAADSLSPRLMNPTPAALREECLAVCKERYDKKDERMLRAVFGPQDGFESYSRAIEIHGLGKFRAVINFLEGKVEAQKSENIELIAWLIDTAHRPYQTDIDYAALLQQKETNKVGNQNEAKTGRNRDKVEAISNNGDGKANTGEGQNVAGGNSGTDRAGCDKLNGNESGVGGEQNDRDGEGTTTLVPEKPASETKDVLLLQPASRIERIKNLIILLLLHKALKPALIMVTVTIVVIYVSIGESTEQSCMYWKEDHFQPAPCYQNTPGSSLIALDAQKLNNFRKITDWTTVTPKDIGVVFYARRAPNLELFTCYGVHPVNPTINLRPLTKYMYDRHVVPRIQELKDSINKLTMKQ